MCNSIYEGPIQAIAFGQNLVEILLRSRCLNVEEDNQLVLNSCVSPVLVHHGFEFTFVKRVVRTSEVAAAWRDPLRFCLHVKELASVVKE